MRAPRSALPFAPNRRPISAFVRSRPRCPPAVRVSPPYRCSSSRTPSCARRMPCVRPLRSNSRGDASTPTAYLSALASSYPSPAPCTVLMRASTRYLAAASTSDSSPSARAPSMCRMSHCSGTLHCGVGRHPHLHRPRADPAAMAARAGVPGGARIALSKPPSTSAPAACVHVIAMPSPSGRGACARYLLVRGPRCPSVCRARLFATSTSSHACLPIGAPDP